MAKPTGKAIRQQQQQQQEQQPVSDVAVAPSTTPTFSYVTDSTLLPNPTHTQRRMPMPPFPNPHAGSTQAIQPTLRRSTPFVMLNAPPPTPPQAMPAAATYGGSHTTSHHPQRRTDHGTPHPLRQARSYVDDDEEVDNEGADDRPTWSSDESTPTPTASSVAAASAQRRQDAKSLMPVELVAPSQALASHRRQLQPASSIQSPAAVSSSPVRAEPPIKAAKEAKGKGVAEKRPESSNSISLPDGRQVPTTRTDFENMRRISRPSSSMTTQSSAVMISNNTSTSNIAQPGKFSGPSSARATVISPVSASAPLPKTPKVQHVTQFEHRPASNGSSQQEELIATLQAYQPHQITPVKEEDEAPLASVGRARRQSQTASLRRQSFESGTTALDTPRIGVEDEGQTSFEIVGRGGDGSMMSVLRSTTQSRKGLVSGTVAPPSDVPEVAESPSGDALRASAAAVVRDSTPRSQGLSAHLEQLHRFINNATGGGSRTGSEQSDEQARAEVKKSSKSKTAPPAGILASSKATPTYVPAGLGGEGRPTTGNSARNRPGTGQSRVSFDDVVRGTGQRRRLGSGGGGGNAAGRMRVFAPTADMLQHFQQPADPSQQQQHTHDQLACRQCFRAGFDCAIQLQTGQGTGARKALQEFVMAGGLDAMSGVEDFYEGSLWASQAAANRANLEGNQGALQPVTGQNFVDKLGEVAFGESALSRPVTRGAVQDMLEQRGQALAERQRSKTVEDFLAELQRLQRDQEEEDALKSIDAEYERSGASQGERQQQQQTTSPRSGGTGRGSTSMQTSTGMRKANRTWRDANEVEEDADATLDDHRSSGRGTPYSGEDLSEEDNLPFLADRWTMRRKMFQLGVCGLWIFCLQAVGSGYATSLPAIARTTGAQMLSLQAGQLAFLFGQGGGMLLGPALGSYGRHRAAPVSVILCAAVCVIVGFIRSGPLITVLRGVLGCLAGVFEILTIGMILDMSTDRPQRLGLLVYTLTFALAAQAGGPWIAEVVLRVGSWSWLYWLAAIMGICYVVLFAWLARETEPCAIYRAQVRKLRMHSNNVWTPEPRRTPSFKPLIVHRILRPITVLVRHGVVALSATLFAVVLGASIAVVGPFASVLSLDHRFEDWKVTLLISVCVAVGLCAGGGALLFLVLGSIGRRRGELSKTHSDRTRVLYMDEKGVIDAQRPAFDAERALLSTALSGSIASVVALYTLALTARTSSWIFSALSLAVLVAGVTMLCVGVLLYLSEAYFPAHYARLGEVLALSDHLGPAPDKGLEHEAADEADAANEDAIQDDYSLMSGAREDGKRWDSSWAMSAVSMALALGLYVGGAMTIVGQLATVRLGFTLFAAIVASCVMGLAGVLVMLLLRFGAGLRRSAFVHIAQTEQKLWLAQRAEGSAVAASALTSTGSLRSTPLSVEDPVARRPSEGEDRRQTGKLRQLFLTPSNEQSLDVENGKMQDRSKRDMSDTQPASRWWPWQWRKRTAIQASAPPQFSISAPYGVQHIASGDGEALTAFDSQSAAPVTPIDLRRMTLVDAEATRAMMKAAKAKKRHDYDDEDEVRVTKNNADGRQKANQDHHHQPMATTIRESSLTIPRKKADRARAGKRPVEAPSLVDIGVSSSSPYRPTPTPSPPASPVPAAHWPSVRQVHNGPRETPTIRLISPRHHAYDERDYIDRQIAAQQAQTIWSGNEGRPRQTSMGGVHVSSTRV